MRIMILRGGEMTGVGEGEWQECCRFNAHLRSSQRSKIIKQTERMQRGHLEKMDTTGDYNMK